ncbi:tetratricopeptide repeat protein [Lacinutrix sp. C3R15]|uniref:tetratricopeptide repeat-containing sensor histidine kinase n=1 Tax=Flavobacteriaceae TaxID=49546 RepID=UPI001C07F39A|nr:MULTISPECIES: tetratricopeptide repeat protein [Flavobacteriaceae]MBU2938840.1 tetratricopeptide repeat protein [Lacinutrix sp. C3R15]MDO6622153.1 tetratricopeptide repeat protein [Oceanihabitans sp. 1_MG-2023]
MKSSVYYMLMVCSIFCYAQEQKIDALEMDFNTIKVVSSEKLQIANQLSSLLQQTNPEKALKFSNQAISLAKTLQLKDKEAIAYKNKALNLVALSKDSLAIEAYNRAIAIQTERKDWNQVARINYNKGLIYFGQSDYIKANAQNVKALDVFKKEKDSFLMAVVLNSIGINQMYQSLYPEAIDSYLKASKIHEQTNTTNTDRYAGILTNIGLLYYRLEKNKEALKYFNKSLETNKKLNSKIGIANALTNIGNVYDDIKQPEKAINYYKESLAIMQSIHNKYGIASALTNTGIAYINLKEYDKALTYLKDTKVLFEELDNSNNLAIVYQSIGTAYFKSALQSENKKENYLKAKNNFENALKYSKKTQSIERQASALEKLGQVNAKLNNYKIAYTNQTEAKKLKDSFMSSEKKEEIAKLEAKYEYEKKEATLTAIHEKQQTLKEAEVSRYKFIKNTSMFVGSTLAIGLTIGFMLYKKKQEANAIAKETAFNLKVSNTELKALRAQMNPHFIFNSLNSIQSYIAKNDIENATNYLTKFSKLMRETLEKSTQKEITLTEDISILKTYLDIENKRANNSFTYNINIDETIDAENTLIPPMILQPFVENSIIHGLRKSTERGKICINYTKEKDMLICSVEDNGIGRAASAANTPNTNKHSLGMRITKSRIEIINKIKDTKGNLHIIDKPNGTKVEVKLPLTLAF